MEIIQCAQDDDGNARERIAIEVERGTLAKRRWRATAQDGREFGFDLERPLADGTTVFADEGKAYRVQQKPEPVLAVRLEEGALQGAADFARLGWLIGNLHFPLALADGAVVVPDDPALRQLFERERIAFEARERVFKPLSGGHSHEHSARSHEH